MYESFSKIRGRNARLFRLDEEVYIFCDRAALPAKMCHTANCYSRGQVVGYVNECSTYNPKVAVRVGGWIIHVPADTYAVLNEAEFNDPCLEDVKSENGTRALIRARDFAQMPQRWSKGSYPGLLVDDSVVVFCTADDRDLLPELANRFVPGHVSHFNLGARVMVMTDKACERADPSSDPHLYHRELQVSTPLIVWRGIYEQMRLHPERITNWLSIFEFPIKIDYGKIEIDYEDFAQRLRESFDYIPPVKYLL